jgi:CRP-like cAMP-binding protein
MTPSRSSLSPGDALVHIRATDIFGTLDEAVLRDVARVVERVALAKGTSLCRQGDAGRDLYFVVRGHLEVTLVQQDSSVLHVGDIGSGQLIGELQLLTGGKRTASLTCSDDIELLKLSSTALDRLIDTHPQLLQSLNTVILGVSPK